MPTKGIVSIPQPRCSGQGRGRTANLRFSGVLSCPEGTSSIRTQALLTGIWPSQACVSHSSGRADKCHRVPFRSWGSRGDLAPGPDLWGFCGADWSTLHRHRAPRRHWLKPLLTVTARAAKPLRTPNPRCCWRTCRRAHRRAYCPLGMTFSAPAAASAICRRGSRSAPARVRSCSAVLNVALMLMKSARPGTSRSRACRSAAPEPFLLLPAPRSRITGRRGSRLWRRCRPASSSGYWGGHRARRPGRLP
jgi:hypothetical protein